MLNNGSRTFNRQVCKIFRRECKTESSGIAVESPYFFDCPILRSTSSICRHDCRTKRVASTLNAGSISGRIISINAMRDPKDRVPVRGLTASCYKRSPDGTDPCVFPKFLNPYLHYSPHGAYDVKGLRCPLTIFCRTIHQLSWRALAHPQNVRARRPGATPTRSVFCRAHRR